MDPAAAIENKEGDVNINEDIQQTQQEGEGTSVPESGEKPPPLKQKKVQNGRQKSGVWEHFTKLSCDTKATCNYCKKVYAAKSKLNGTSTMWNHLKEQCMASPIRVKLQNQKVLSFEPKKEGDGKGTLKAVCFNQEELRKVLTKFIVLDELPFKFVEGQGFRMYSQALEPRFTIPSRFTVARDCLKLYDEQKKILKKVLKSHRVCLTTDTWTSVQNLDYMCLTAHWIDSDWKLNKRIINFCQVFNHKGETIGKMVESCLVEWGIEQFFTLTVDNASSNNGAIRYLKRKTKNWKGTVMDHEFLHLRCCAHIINLIVKEGLKDVDESIVKIRNSIRYVRSSPSRAAIFQKCVEMAKIECKSHLCLDVETRWNSTYLMLETASKFEEAFERLEEEDDKYLFYFQRGELDDHDDDGVEGEIENRRGRGNKYIGPPTQLDWEKANSFMKFLKIFYNATLKISGSLHVTSNLFFQEMVALQSRMVQMSKSGDFTLNCMATRMMSKFDKYWDNLDNINFLLYVAVVLDPRYKMKYVEFCLHNLYDKTKAIHRLERVQTTLSRLFDFYNMQSNDSSSGACGLSQGLNTMEMDESEEDSSSFLDSQFQRHLEEHDCDENVSELTRYLGESVENLKKRKEEFDLLNWWKVNAAKYPVLSQLAKDVLAVPVSTVSSESAFSTGGRIIDPFRSSLSPKMAEALICCQNWLKTTPTPVNIRESLDEVEKIEQIVKEYSSSTVPIEPTPIDE